MIIQYSRTLVSEYNSNKIDVYFPISFSSEFYSIVCIRFTSISGGNIIPINPAINTKNHAILYVNKENVNIETRWYSGYIAIGSLSPIS